MGSLYSDHRTWLHAVRASVKLAALALLGTALFATRHPGVLVVVALACCLLFVSLGRATLPSRKLLISVVVAALLVAAFHAWMGQPMQGAISVMRLLSASLLGLALTLTTRSSDLLALIETLLSPLARLGVKTDAIAMQLALMLRFTEHFFVQWKRLDDAYRVRTGKSGGLRLLAPLTLRMLVSARRVGDALDLRLGP
jgi:biotin transport system permease protein